MRHRPDAERQCPLQPSASGGAAWRAVRSVSRNIGRPGPLPAGEGSRSEARPGSSAGGDWLAGTGKVGTRKTRRCQALKTRGQKLHPGVGNGKLCLRGCQDTSADAGLPADHATPPSESAFAPTCHHCIDQHGSAKRSAERTAGAAILARHPLRFAVVQVGGTTALMGHYGNSSACGEIQHGRGA